jgi:hypothetical protein
MIIGAEKYSTFGKPPGLPDPFMQASLFHKPIKTDL